MPDSRLVIFDFCGTLIRFQTADRYVRFCVERLKANKSVQRRNALIRLMDKLRIFKLYNLLFPGNNWRKRMVLSELKGVEYVVCDRLAHEYFTEELLPGIVAPLAEKLQEHLSQGDRVCILSGGYDIYIKYFAEYFGVKEVISSKISFVEGVCTGEMAGADCMRGNKLDYIRPLLQGSKTICYTDSQSDIPLLEAVDTPVVVSRSKPQQWATQRNYNQIIWD